MYAAIVAAALLGQMYAYPAPQMSMQPPLMSAAEFAYGAPYGGQYPTYQYPFNYQVYPMDGSTYSSYSTVPYFRDRGAPYYGGGWGGFYRGWR